MSRPIRTCLSDLRALSPDESAVVKLTLTLVIASSVACAVTSAAMTTDVVTRAAHEQGGAARP